MNLSVVVPIFNDGALARSFVLEAKRVLNNFEIVFVDDGSIDNSLELLVELRKEFSFVKIISLSRNFGHHIAISCGYRAAKGDYIANLNVDMEDPVDQILVLRNKLIEQDADICHGLYLDRKVSFLQKLTSMGFQILLNFLTGTRIPLNLSTLRVCTREFINSYNSLKERERYIPGLEVWLGFKHIYVPTPHQKRTIGKSSYNWKRRWKLAFNTILSFSDLPLRTICYVGFSIAAIGISLNIVMLVQKITGVEYLRGYASLISVIVLLSGIQIFVTGLSGLYIGRILAEVQQRPLYVVRETHGFDDFEQ